MKPNSGPKVATNAVIAFDRQVIAKTLRDYAKPTSLIASDAINGGEPSAASAAPIAPHHSQA
jgi:hypothetical protein